jgi:hypothetical protein
MNGRYIRILALILMAFAAFIAGYMVKTYSYARTFRELNQFSHSMWVNGFDMAVDDAYAELPPEQALGVLLYWSKQWQSHGRAIQADKLVTPQFFRERSAILNGRIAKCYSRMSRPEQAAQFWQKAADAAADTTNRVSVVDVQTVVERLDAHLIENRKAANKVPEDTVRKLPDPQH